MWDIRGRTVAIWLSVLLAVIGGSLVGAAPAGAAAGCRIVLKAPARYQKTLLRGAARVVCDAKMASVKLSVQLVSDLNPPVIDQQAFVAERSKSTPLTYVGGSCVNATYHLQATAVFVRFNGTADEVSARTPVKRFTGCREPQSEFVLNAKAFGPASVGQTVRVEIAGSARAQACSEGPASGGLWQSVCSGFYSFGTAARLTVVGEGLNGPTEGFWCNRGTTAGPVERWVASGGDLTMDDNWLCVAGRHADGPAQ